MSVEAIGMTVREGREVVVCNLFPKGISGCSTRS